MANTLITSKFKTTTIDNIVRSITDKEDSYYFFIADHLDIANSESLVNTTELTEFDIYKNIIQGKLVTSSDIKPIVNKNAYIPSTVYTMYEHDIDLTDEKFYVSVDEGSYIHFYKCLDNNSGNLSTAQPTFSHISGANTEFYRTSDGYLWKYMGTVSSAEKLKFGTNDYLPIVANSTVTENAQSEVIDMIKVETGGRKYDNYINGSFATADITVSGNSTVYKITDSAKNSNSFYSGCLLYLSAGTGAGQTKTVVDYYANNDGKYIVVESAFSPTPTNGTSYQINPKVNVFGHGLETKPVIARALINAVSTNSVYRVEILDKGKGFTHMATANVYANSVVGVQAESSLKVILPPRGGHGYDIVDELQASKVEISVKTVNSESSTLSTSNGFKQIGLIKNPTFANVVLNISNTTGVFISDEIVYKIEPAKITSSAVTNSSSNVISVSLDSYLNNIKAGNKLLVSDTVNQLATVTAVNTTAIQISTNSFFDSSNATIYFANESASGYCLFTNSISVRLSNTSNKFSTDDTIIGSSSGAFGKITTIARNGETKGFNTFINLNKLVGSLDTGTFIENEVVYYGSLSFANSYLHSSYSTNTDFVLLVSNILGDINNTNTAIGQTSGARASITSRFTPELQYNSGEIIYLENINRITRSANSSEAFQFIFEF